MQQPVSTRVAVRSTRAKRCRQCYHWSIRRGEGGSGSGYCPPPAYPYSEVVAEERSADDAAVRTDLGMSIIKMCPVRHAVVGAARDMERALSSSHGGNTVSWLTRWERESGPPKIALVMHRWRGHRSSAVSPPGGAPIPVHVVRDAGRRRRRSQTVVAGTCALPLTNDTLLG
jgi:hypothetical protein